MDEKLKLKVGELIDMNQKAAVLEQEVKQGLRDYLLGQCKSKSPLKISIIQASQLGDSWLPCSFNSDDQLEKLVSLLENRSIERVYELFRIVVDKGRLDVFKNLLFNAEVRSIVAGIV